MSEWKDYLLGDISSMKYGSMPKKELIRETGYPIFSGYRITGYYPKFNCENQEIVVVARGVGGTGDIKISPPKSFITNLSIVVKIDENIVDKKYFFYKFQKHNLRYLDSGSAQSQITIDALKRLSIYIPSLKEQRKVVNILSCLDAKIKNLRRQNETLENIAQTLFKHWFIDFEFPNADGKPYKSSGGAMFASELGDIPEGWRVLTLQQICKTVYRYPQFYGMEKVESGVPVIRGEHLLTNGRISSNFNDYWFVSEEYSKKFPKTVLEEFDVVLSVRGSVGNYSVVGKKHIGVQISPNTIRLSANPKILKNFLLYPCLKSNHFKKKLLMTVSSSAVPAINAVEFKTFEYVVPDILIQDRLSGIFKNFYSKIDANENQIQPLTKTRDSLLPKLMSGQLRVKE